MRTRTGVRTALLCSLAAAAVVPSTALAAPHHDHGLTISASPNPIVAGNGVYIYGKLEGGDVANQPIELFHRIAPAKTFTLISKGYTNSDGFYGFTRAEGVVMTNRDWYVKGPDGSHSRTIDERVASTLTLDESSDTATTGQKVLFSGTVTPAHPGQTVLIQESSSVTGSGWQTIASGRTNAASSFAITHAFRTGGDETLRAVLPADRRNTEGSSDSVTLAVQQTQNPNFTIAASPDTLTIGGSVTLSGALGGSNGASGVPVALYARTSGGAFREVDSMMTGSGGSYSFTQTPSSNTAYQVRSASERTAVLYEAVADTVSLTPSTTATAVGDTVSFTGTVSPDHANHLIYLQEQTAKGGWQNIASGRVGTASNYQLSTMFGRTGTFVIRARIFGGPDNVGAASTPVDVTVSNPAS